MQPSTAEIESDIRSKFDSLLVQADRVHRDVARGHYVPFWTLLYAPLNEVRRLLPEGLALLGLPSQSADTFLQQLVGFTLEHGKAHWTELAVDWLESGLPVDKRLAEAVDRMVEKKQGSQRARHRAFAVVARWRKAGGEAA